MATGVSGSTHTMAALILASVLAAAASLPAAAQEVHTFHVTTEDSSRAIREFGKQSGLQILAAAEDIKGTRLNPIVGSISTEQAIIRLLDGTGLEHRYVGDRAIALVSKENGEDAAPRTAPNPTSQNPQAKSKADATQAKPSFWDRFRLAQSNQGSVQDSPGPGDGPAAAADSVTEAETSGIGEIVITAQKRDERLQEVPVPVSVVSAESLTQNNLPRLQDFYSTVPGLNMSPPAGGSGEQNIAIRGITSGAGASPTVAVTLDDVPFGFATGLIGDIIPDFDPTDLARVEVLRGPQGALYGASGLGGLIKYVTLDPSTAELNGRAQADVSGIKNGSGIGYGIRGSVNVPLSDTLAIRASAFNRRTPAYIDNPVLGIRGINEENAHGGRLAALWSPSDTWSVKLSALAQDARGDGANEVNLPTAGYPQADGLGDLQQNYIRGIGGYQKKIQAYSAIIEARTGAVDLTSVTGYSITHSLASLDYSYALESAAQSSFGVPGAAFVDDAKIRNFTQELRASLPLGERVDWLVGAFFTHQVADHAFALPAVDPMNGAFVGDLLTSRYEPGDGLKYQEIAAFTDLTVHFTDRFDVQVGGRESRMTNGSDAVYNGGVLNGPVTVVSPGYNPKSTAFTYLLTPRFRISPDLMTYIRLASGYRPGGGGPAGPDAVCVLHDFPCEYDPDKTNNYEIGIKGDALDHRLTFDASIFYIDWKNIQLRAVVPNEVYGYTTNGSAAKSQGIEASVEARPWAGSTVAVWAAYNDAVLTRNFPTGSLYYGVSGNRLPFSTRFSSNISVTQDFAVAANATAFAGFTVTYQGNSLGNFDLVPDRQLYPSFTKVDLRGGLKYGNAWTVNLYANNVTDRRAVIGGGGAYNFPPYGYVVLQPRTLGLALQYKF